MENVVLMSEDTYEEVLKRVLFNADMDDFSESFYELNGKINKNYGMDECSISNLVNFIPVSESCEYLDDLSEITEHLIENKNLFKTVSTSRVFSVDGNQVVIINNEDDKNLSSRKILNKLVDCNKEEFNKAILESIKEVMRYK